jgi:hypothetical protein
MAQIWKELKLPGIHVQKICLNIFHEVSVLEEDVPEEVFAMDLLNGSLVAGSNYCDH